MFEPGVSEASASSGSRRKTNASVPLQTILEIGETSIPASLHDSLMARLDRIPDRRRHVCLE